MTFDVELATDEVVILEANGVCSGGRVGYTDDLVLTNHSVIHIKKGWFGKAKDITRYDLSSVKVYNDQAQAKIGKRRDGTPQLELYLRNGQVAFGFESKREVLKWVESINKLVTGREITIETGKLAIPGTDLIAKTLKGTIDTAKEAFGMRLKKDSKISTKCCNCGAPISGDKGETKRCPFCDVFVSF